MDASTSPGLFKDVVIILAAAGVVIPLFHRLRVSSVFGFMLVGALIGPFGLGRLSGSDIADTHSLFTDGWRALNKVGIMRLWFCESHFGGVIPSLLGQSAAPLDGQGPHASSRCTRAGRCRR